MTQQYLLHCSTTTKEACQSTEMGVTGVHVFEDDMSCSHLAHCNDLVAPFDDFRESLHRALGSEYVETDLSGEVLTVAMLLVALANPIEIGNMSYDELQEPYRAMVVRFGDRHSDSWTSLKTQEQRELIGLTVESIGKKVLNSSCCESYELWMDTDELDDWVAVVEGVRDMLVRVGDVL